MKIYSEKESFQIAEQLDKILSIAPVITNYNLLVEYPVENNDKKIPGKAYARTLNYTVTWEQYLRIEPFLIANGFYFKVTVKF